MSNHTLEAFRLAKSCSGKEGLKEANLESLAAAGIYTMEVSFGQESWCENIPWKEAGLAAKRCGVELWSFHLPFGPFEHIDISSVDEALRRRTVSYLSELIRQAGDIGITTMVIHPSGEPLKEEERGARMACAKESLAELAEVAARNGAVIAVENLPRTCLGRDSADMLELLSADKRLASTFDTNHLLSQPAVEYLQQVGPYLRTTHVSDYDFRNERHWLPGEGQIDWKELVSALKAANYSGPFLYELGLEAPASIDRRVLTYDDFRMNYEAIMRGEQPEAVGTPIEARCPHWKTLV